MKMGTKLALAVAAGVTAYLVVRSAARATGEAAGRTLAAVGEAVNPLSTNNLAYTGANAVVQSVTGQKDQTLGGWIYDLFNEDPMAKADRLYREQKQREAANELLRESRRNPWVSEEQNTLADQVPPSPFNVGA